MKLNKKIFIIALILSLLSSYLSYSYLKNSKEGNNKDEYIDIIVASKDILPREKIDESMVVKSKVKKEDYFINSIKNKERLIGMYTKEKILKGEVFHKERLTGKNEKDLSFNIPVGKRAVSISVDEISGVADLIKPSDYVDIYVTLQEVRFGDTIAYPQQTKLILQNIQVLTIGKEQIRKEEERSEIPNRYAITLALNSIDAEKLILGEGMGHLKLALRPVKENTIDSTWGAKREDLLK